MTRFLTVLACVAAGVLGFGCTASRTPAEDRVSPEHSRILLETNTDSEIISGVISGSSFDHVWHPSVPRDPTARQRVRAFLDRGGDPSHWEMAGSSERAMVMSRPAGTSRADAAAERLVLRYAWVEPKNDWFLTDVQLVPAAEGEQQWEEFLRSGDDVQRLPERAE